MLQTPRASLSWCPHQGLGSRESWVLDSLSSSLHSRLAKVRRVKTPGEWQEPFKNVVGVVELSSSFTEVVGHLEVVECDHKESGVRDKEPREELWVQDSSWRFYIRRQSQKTGPILIRSSSADRITDWLVPKQSPQGERSSGKIQFRESFDSLDSHCHTFAHFFIWGRRVQNAKSINKHHI